MPRLSLSILFILSFCMPINGFALRNAAIIESAREIPLAYDVDVIVVGGTTRGVAAAVAAANAGAKVFLCTDRPYLGEDMCATYRLWLEDGETPESGLAKSIFLGEPDTNTVTTAPVVRMPTPMTVKIALDTALLDAGVTFLYGSYMADVLHDSKGRFAGITIVNRSGRQAIRGKVIIDATERAMAARICGAEFMPYPAGKQSFKRIVIGGDPGDAAGKASAMAAENGTTVRKIDVKALQRHLVDVGIIPERFLSVEDSYPLSDDAMQVAVKQIGTNYSGIAVVLSDTKRALPHLRSAYVSATDEAQKLRYAHVLGMLFDDTGTATLIKAVTAGAWDKGWNFRGLGQYGATTSYMDNLVIALGRTRDTRGLPTVLVKLKALTPESEFSHCRAVAMALETFMDPRAAKPLSDFLQQPGISGHSFLEIRDVIERTPVKPTRSDTSTRNHSLRELILARALYRCGDQKGVGEAVLKNYAIDYRGHYARHAKSVLQGDDG